jgi:hypothetical protein
VDTGPFDTIESAQDFMALLRDSIDDTRQDVERDLIAATTGHEDRLTQALRLTLMKMNQLASAVDRSQRLLNDLRTLRRLIFNERNIRAILVSRLSDASSDAGRTDEAS